MDADSPRLRLSILGIVAISLFAALFARLWYLQVMAAPEFQVEAQANRVRTVTEEAPRGRIFDINGRVIVDNRTSLVVTVNPHDLQSVEGKDDLLMKLSQTLTSHGVPTKLATIQRRLNDKQYNPLQPVPVAIDVPEDLQVYLAERADEYPAVEVRRESVRKYPFGSAAANILGYVGRISEAELEEKQGTKDDPKDNPKTYEPDANIGKTGVEKTYEDDLRGTPGIRTIEVDAKNRPIRTVDYQAPRPGSDIVLTVNLDVQQAAENGLAEQLLAQRGQRSRDGSLTKAPAGSAVVLDPNNGGVVAMASYPTYDPEEFVNGISSERYAQLTGGAESDNPFIDRAIQGLYAPGSTFKLITATAAMQSGMIDARTSYQDSGVYKVGTQEFANAGRTPHGSVNVRRALTVSSDVFFYWLGDRFDDRSTYGDGIQGTARTYGFGTATGVELPGERAGIIPDPITKKKRHDDNPKAFPEGNWYTGDNVNTAIGQGDVLATPLQLANAYATFANGGTVYQPHVVARVMQPMSDPNDPAAVVRVVEPVVIGKVDLPANVRDPIHEGLTGVSTSGEGTAVGVWQGFNQTAFPVASKTGTAQVNGKADTSIYAAYAPADAPRYAAAAVLEEAGFGADAAAPVIRHIFEVVSGQPVTPVTSHQGTIRD